MSFQHERAVPLCIIVGMASSPHLTERAKRSQKSFLAPALAVGRRAPSI